MAPRFKQLLFQIYKGDQSVDAFIGFPINQSEQMFALRDALHDEFERISGFAYRKYAVGPYDIIDVSVKFFDSKDADALNAFYSKPRPGFFSWLFRSQYYRNHKTEEESINKLIKIEISTSHDYPCIVIKSSVLTDDAIAQLIEKVADGLNLSIVRSRFPDTLASILMFNRSFEIKKPTHNPFAA